MELWKQILVQSSPEYHFVTGIWMVLKNHCNKNILLNTTTLICLSETFLDSSSESGDDSLKIDGLFF